MTRENTNFDSRGRYEVWHELRAQGEDSQATLQAPWNVFAQKRLSDIKGKKILELACGRGQLSAVLARRGAEVIAGDFSFQALSVLKKEHFHAGVYPVNADAQRLPIQDASVDIVVSCETIEHVVNPQQVLREFRRVLKKGGILLLTCPSYLNFYGLYRVYLKLLGRPYNSGTLTQPVENWLFNFQVQSWLRKSGFKINFRGGVGHYSLWPGRMPKSILNLDESFWVNKVLRLFALHAFFIAEKIDA